MILILPLDKTKELELYQGWFNYNVMYNLVTTKTPIHFNIGKHLKTIH